MTITQATRTSWNRSARGLRVVRAPSPSSGRNLTASQISQSTGLSLALPCGDASTLHCTSSAMWGEDNKRFYLRPQILALGHAYLSSTPLAVSAQPYLDEVSQALRESCSAAILDGDDIVYICRSAEKRVLSINLLVGTRLPAYCTSMGQVLLAHLPPLALEEYLGRVRLVKRTDRTITSRARLRAQLAQVREAGFAMLDQELEAGLRSIAVPVRDARGAVVAAINVGTHASRATPEEMRRRFLPPLAACAQGLEKLLPA